MNTYEAQGSRGPLPHTLLYVEDNPANLRLIGQIIARRLGLRRLAAVDRTSGIEIASGSRPDAIIMDINLPGIRGSKSMVILGQIPAQRTLPRLLPRLDSVPIRCPLTSKAAWRKDSAAISPSRSKTPRPLPEKLRQAIEAWEAGDTPG